MNVRWVAVIVGLGVGCSGSRTFIVDTDVIVVDTADTAPTIEPTDVSTDLTVRVVGAPTCAGSGGRGANRFTRVKLSHKNPANFPNDFPIPNGGPTVVDLDGDGNLEVLVSVGKAALHAFTVTPQGFVDRSHHVFGGVAIPAVGAAAAADLDGDGLPELLLSRVGAPPLLMGNVGGVLVDRSTVARMPTTNLRSNGASWADIDGDGDLDLFIANFGPAGPAAGNADEFGAGFPSRLFINNGAGIFADATRRIPLPARVGYTFVGAFVDLNDDGAPDLYMVNDFGQLWGGNTLLWNDGTGFFTPDDGSAGLNLAVEGMGVDVGDFNGDGQPDFVVPAWGEVAFLTSFGGRWIRQDGASNLVPDLSRNQLVAWGGQIADLDNDGFDDVMVQYGDVTTLDGFDSPAFQPDAIYRNQGDNTFVDVGAAWGVDDAMGSRGALAIDLNGDGWLDLVKVFRDDYPLVYIAKCGDAAWLSVSLEQPGLNRDAVGATVEVLDGDRRWKRWLRAGGVALGASSTPHAHFGLGGRDVVTQVRVTWPDGRVSTVDNVPTKRILKLVRQASGAP